jgi:hypothetical protein
MTEDRKAIFDLENPMLDAESAASLLQQELTNFDEVNGIGGAIYLCAQIRKHLTELHSQFQVALEAHRAHGGAK